ncbi:MAG: hypothetical protein IJ682_03540 [Lachnospiraceae bacterium]|nr:hypothetical protein [Lachnospiraceae bacterium]
MNALRENAKYRYCVLYVTVTEQHKLQELLARSLPEGRGEAFCPCMEYYRRGEKQIKVRAIFPGYVFVYTDLNIREIHELLRARRMEMKSKARELALREKQFIDPDFLQEAEDHTEIYEMSDLDSKEEEFLDFLRKGDGLLRMSKGYEEDRQYFVMEGPLKVYEQAILKVDKHNKKAFLKFEYNGHMAQAGFECKPKAHWYPDAEARLATLSDTSEVDLTELKKKMMSRK